MIPLFNKFPLLAVSLNYHRLANLPTPVLRLENLSKKLSRDDLFIKRDDLSTNLYGGNKIRKLEFIFGDVLASGSTHLITSGAAGSNHALAVAIFGAQLGLEVTLMLFEQPYNEEISNNLLADYASGAQLHLDSSYESHIASLNKVIEENDAEKTFVIPPGGSSVSGVCGYINAAFELKEQIGKGELPEPKTIFVALGTMGTAVGLVLGLKAAGLQSKVVAVRVVPSYVSDSQKFSALFESTNRMLHEKDPSFPLCNLTDDDLSFESDFLGPGYGYITAESQTAIDCLQKTEGLKLDGVYTGKTFAAFLEMAKKEKQNGPLLFWNTKNSLPLDQLKAGADFRQLPENFHKYFR